MKHCPHCHPMRPTHGDDKLNSILSHLLVDPIFLISKKIFPLEKFNHLITKILNHKLEPVEFKRDEFRKRVQVIYDEAINQNLKIELLKNNYFRLYINNQKIYFKENPLSEMSIHGSDFDRKDLFKKFLHKNNYQTPQGKVFWSKARAYSYGLKLDFPLTVKPSDSSNSRHVSIKVMDEKYLKEAIKIAKQLSHKIIIERFVTGAVYRVLFLENKVIAVAKRLPSAGEEKININLGGSVHEMTAELNSDVKEKLNKIAQKIPTPMFAFDLISENINYKEFYIIEYNSLPYIDLHHFPTSGNPINVAEKIINYLKK